MTRALLFALLMSFAACGRREAPSGRWGVARPDAGPTTSSDDSTKGFTPATPPTLDATASEPAAGSAAPPVAADAGSPDVSAALDDPRATPQDAGTDADARPCPDAARCD
jgi:hypothetical protein